jgi:hypothetical protein
MSLICSSGISDINMLEGFLIALDRYGLVSSYSSIAGIGRSRSIYFYTLFAST